MGTGNRSERRKVSLGMGAQLVSEGQHICYIYNDEAERRRVMGRYVESGLLGNEKVLYVADQATPEDILASFAGLGVEIKTKRPSLSLTSASETYNPAGVFSADEMLDLTRDFYRQAVDRDGYDGARGAGEMSWCLADGGVDQATLLDYEARLTLLLDDCPYTACCQYDAHRFDGAFLLDVMSVHPVMIIRGQLVRNPFYVEPLLFLEQLKSRQEGAAI